MVNSLSVIIAAIAAMVLGMSWYTPKTLGKLWMKLANVDSNKKDGMAWRPLVGLLSYAVMAYVLATIFELTGTIGLNSGLYIAFLLWLGFVGTTTLGSFLWERKPFNLWLLNNTYNLLALLLMAWVLLSWT